jgi:hypothetical protein
MRMIPKPEPGAYPEYAEIYMSLLPGDGYRALRFARNTQQNLIGFDQTSGRNS